MKKLLLLVFLLSLNIIYSQVTIVSDGLNNTSSLFTVSGGSYFSGNSTSSDRPASSPFASEGVYSYGVNGSGATLTSNVDINTLTYSSISMSFRLATFSKGSSSNGADDTDIVTVEVSPDGGVTYYKTLRVIGNSNANWSYSGGTANASTAYDGDGSPIDFSPSGGGNRTTDGYSTATITGLPSVSNLRFRITLLNDSSGEIWVVDDFKVKGTVSCTPPTLSSVYPTSGPVGTEVTINASSGSLVGATATFGGVTATTVSSASTKLVVKVPSGALSGNLVITSTQPCGVSTTFTVINKDATTCQGATLPTDLFFSEITDSNTGSLTYVEIYNATGNTINLSSYSVKTANNGLSYTNTLALNNVNLATGSTYVVALGKDSSCASTAGADGSYASQNNTTGSINFTIDGNDHIGLFKGSTLIDSWGIFGDVNWCPANIGEEGADFRRKNSATLPSTTYNNNDWDIYDYAGIGSSFCSNNDYSNIGVYSYSSSLGLVPKVTSQPSVNLSCTSESIQLTVSGAEGFVGGNSLAYQWFVLPPNTTSWTSISNSGVYSGATTATLSISSYVGLDGYQYYCQVRENLATCYAASQAVKINDTYSTTWDGNSWSNGTPTLTKLTIINGTYNTTTNGDIDACSLIVNSNYTATITSNHYINIQNNLTVNGILNIQNNGSLVQIDDSGTNSGWINMDRTVSIRKLDYVYWASPVLNFAVSNISTGTSLSYIFKWSPTISNNYGNWVNANENMTKGKGYIVRSPDSYSSTLTPFTTTFSGVPNNGIITTNIQRGNYQGVDYLNPINNIYVTKYDDNWNLVGNPYPSAIKALDFLNANTNLDGFVNIWTHGTLPSNAIVDPFYDHFVYNYTVNDYITYNGTGTTSGPTGFNGYIASGQGFFVNMLDGVADASQSVTFKNSMRSKLYSNSQFYRTSPLHFIHDQNRIWLDLISEDLKKTNRILIGYVSGATNDRDRMFDAVTKIEEEQNFYSILQNEPFVIQGKKVPFDSDDRVLLGVNIPVSGNYTMAISDLDGLFLDPNNPIYIEDKELHTLSDIKSSPYRFYANKGKIDNRFVLRYSKENLGFESNSWNWESSIIVSTKPNQVTITSPSEKIERIAIYDMLGKLIYNQPNCNSVEYSIHDLNTESKIVLLKLTLENGQILFKKAGLD